MSLANWSGLRVTLVAFAWPILVVAVVIWRLSRLMAKSQGIGAVSAGMAETLLILVGPPILLVVAWLYLKRGVH